MHAHAQRLIPRESPATTTSTPLINHAIMLQAVARTCGARLVCVTLPPAQTCAATLHRQSHRRTTHSTGPNTGAPTGPAKTGMAAPPRPGTRARKSTTISGALTPGVRAGRGARPATLVELTATLLMLGLRAAIRGAIRVAIRVAMRVAMRAGGILGIIGIITGAAGTRTR